MKINDIFFNLNLTCNACGKENDKGYFCEKCRKELPFNDVICDKCGRSTINKENRCMSCDDRELHFEKARSVFKYLTPINVMIKRLKYRHKKYLAKIFSPVMAQILLTEFKDTDFIINVPMHKKDKFIRGYNQTEVLATEISKITEIDYKKDIFKKHIRTKRQATLNKEERRKNLKKAFILQDKKLVKGKVITIIDDIMTTGSTIETLAEKLIKAKAKKVYVLTIASVGERERNQPKNSTTLWQKIKNSKLFAKIFQKRYLHKGKNIVK